MSTSEYKWVQWVHVKSFRETSLRADQWGILFEPQPLVLFVHLAKLKLQWVNHQVRENTQKTKSPQNLLSSQLPTCPSALGWNLVSSRDTAPSLRSYLGFGAPRPRSRVECFENFTHFSGKFWSLRLQHARETFISTFNVENMESPCDIELIYYTYYTYATNTTFVISCDSFIQIEH